jgi:spore maturation protein CgeB
MREGKFGLEMLNGIAATKVTLNVHADASIRFASNMRLFESAGAGGCLLTDWKENIPRLFEPDKEIVTYRSFEECIDKIRWLVARPAECEAIGRAAQQRVLREHTYRHRAERLAEIVRSALSQRDPSLV